MKKKNLTMALAGFSAGAVTGLFGAGGGMVLVPLLTGITELEEKEVFPASVSIILPTCLISLLFSHDWSAFSSGPAWGLLLGSAIGGVAAGFWGKHVPTTWLHRILGGLIIWGGFRYLC